MKEYITLGNSKLNLKQFISKVKNYDVELTRKEIYNVIEKAEQNNPADIPAILNTVNKTYHLNIAF